MSEEIIIKNLSTTKTTKLDIPKNLPHPPLAMAIIGPRYSGKSNLIKNIFCRKDMLGKIFDPENIFIFCASIHFNDDFDNLDTEHKYDYWDENVVQEIYDSQANNIELYGKNRLAHVLIICDDMFDNPQFIKSKIIQTLFMRGRHLNISLVLSGQKFSSIPRGARLNITQLIIFRPYSQNEYDYILEETCAKSQKKEMMRKMDLVFETPFNFIFFDHLNKKKEKRIRIGFSESF